MKPFFPVFSQKIRMTHPCILKSTREWAIIKDRIHNSDSLVHHQISTFNDFLNFGIRNVIDNDNTVRVRHDNYSYCLTFSNVFVGRPIIVEENRSCHPLTPNECRIRDLTYQSPIYVDVRESINDSTHKVHHRVLIAHLPIMIGCAKCNITGVLDKTRYDECAWDKGGYFVVKGKERVLVSQLRGVYNTILTYQEKSYSKNLVTSEMRSISKGTAHSVLVSVSMKRDSKEIVCSIPYVKDTLPVGILLRALDVDPSDFTESIFPGGVCSWVERLARLNSNADSKTQHGVPSKTADHRLDTTSLSKKIMFNLKQIQKSSQTVRTHEDAQYFIGNQAFYSTPHRERINYAKQVIERELFPHLDTDSPVQDKLHIICSMIRRVLLVWAGLRCVDDRDDFAYKRVDSCGQLFTDLFKTLFKRYTNTIMAYIEKKKLRRPEAISFMSRLTLITKGILYCIQTGNWGVRKSNYIRQGVSQILSRLSFGATLSHLRRMNIPSAKEGRNSKIRQIHGSQIMFVCPAETPEGQGVGVVLNLSLLTTISCLIPTWKIIHIVRQLVQLANTPNPGMLAADQKENECFWISLNGILVGVTHYPYRLYCLVRDARVNRYLHRQVSISVNKWDRTVQVRSDHGRLLRPVLHKPLTTRCWEEAEDLGQIIWVDNAEAESCNFFFSDTEWKESMLSQRVDEVQSKKCTNVGWLPHYREIHPSLMLGVMGSMIPFPDHSQAPRNAFQASMGKQAMSMFSTALHRRVDNTVHVLNYPQKPLVTTQLAQIMGFSDMPSGINAIVAIACYGGMNQEDSVIVNRSAIERGLFVATTYKTHICEEKKEGTYHHMQICKVQRELQRGGFDYSKLGDDGIIKVRDDKGRSVKVQQDTVMIGQVFVTTCKQGKVTTKDNSIVASKGDEGIVDRVEISITPDGYKLVKVVVRRTRIPEIGDKCACFISKAEVLTDDGWISIADVKLTHKVAILDGENMVYEHPQKVHEYDYKGKMYKLRSQLVDLTITPNHRMWVKKRGKNAEFDFMRADEGFGKRLKHKKTAYAFEPEKWIGDTFTIPEMVDGRGNVRSEVVVNMHPWLVFFGIFIAEGWTSKHSVVIAANKPRVQTALNACFKQLPFELRFYEKSKKMNVFDVQLVKYMKQFSPGATKKFLPDWCWFLNKAQARLLIESMELGDGHTTKSNSHGYYTSSKRLMQDLTRLVQHAGWSSFARVPPSKKAGAQTTMKDGRVIQSTADNWTITTIRTKLEPTINHGHTKRQHGQTEEWIDYDGKVYCLTVRTGVFLVRENMKPVFTGNSRAAQKSTIGMVYSQEDMPFTVDGMTPDMIINPHAMPSRMTINQLLETALGKICSIDGRQADASPFQQDNVADQVAQRLVELGHRDCTEELYSGFTGEKMEARIFMGPTYYQRLKHLVSDKIHARAQGRVTTLTRQPPEGRSRNGGLRVGEMETWSLLVHGTSRFLKERMFDCSDPWSAPVCSKCKYFSNTNDYCVNCMTANNVRQVNIPYSSKLLLQELNAMGIKTELEV